MVLKAAVIVLLVSGSLQIGAVDKNERFEDFSGEISEESKSQDSYIKQKKQFQNNEKSQEKNYRDVNVEATHQFQRDYSRWDDKSIFKSNPDEHKNSKNYMKINEIDSDEVFDKYNKYGKTFNPNLHKDVKKSKSDYNDKQALENSIEDENKPRNLLYDTKVNYINNNKKLSDDSEIISKNPINLKNKENYVENYQNRNEMKVKRYKKDFYKNVLKIDLSNIPSPNDTVLMARYIVHAVDWAALGTISGRAPTKSAPFVCVKATSDGMENSSSGIPFFYMSPMDLCTQDLEKDNRVSVLVTLSETQYCKNKNLDPQDPRCAKLTLSGKIKRIKPGSDEEKFAKTALFSRHPVMASWPVDHNWYFTKLKIGQIILLDKFGGATYIKVKDYLNGGNLEPEF